MLYSFAFCYGHANTILESIDAYIGVGPSKLDVAIPIPVFFFGQLNTNRGGM